MSSLLLLFSAHSFIFPQKKKIVHIEDKREQRHCSLWELRKIIIHGPIILITVTRAGWLVLGQGVNFSKHLEATRYDGLRPIVSRSFSMRLETCFAAHPSPYIVLVWIYSDTSSFWWNFAVVSSCRLYSKKKYKPGTAKLLYKKPTKT